MAAYIFIPKLGMSTSDVTLVEWKAKEGDWVEKSSVVLEIETEKIKWDIEAAASGFLHIWVVEGDKAAIGRVVGLIAETREELEALQKEPPKEIFTQVREVETEPVAKAAEAKPVARTEEGMHIRISPVARKMAEEHMIDITKVAGTGPGGRIVREDIEKAIAAKGKAEVTAEVYQGKRVKATIPLKGMRRAIAEHMHRSLAESAQLTAMGEIDMTEPVKLRKDLLARDVIGTKITYTDIFVFAVARVLKEKPVVNSSLIGNEIKLWEDINIGVAVALEEGIIVPVIKNADSKSIVEISKGVKTLAEKARAGKLMPDEVTGGTFTITNLGAAGAGWRFETAIINQPESAILGTGGITDRAVVRDGQIVIRPIMTYSFTYDHRVVDGALAVQFMARVIELLETPGLLSL